MSPSLEVLISNLDHEKTLIVVHRSPIQMQSGLNAYERKILSNSVLPSNLKFSKEDIVGQDELIEKIMTNVIVPIRLKNRFKQGDVELPKGELFPL